MAIASDASPVDSKKRRKWFYWCRPTFSPEQGVLLVLFGSFLTGAALAQQWNQSTNLALACAFCVLQLEHPYVVQLKQRKNWKPRFLIWGGIYGAIALTMAIFLWLQSPVLLWIYSLALIGFIVDSVAVIQKNINQLLTRSVSLLPFAYQLL